MFLHLPIGALTLVLVMEFLRCLSRGKYKPQTTIGLFFTAVTGVLALIFGYCLYLTGDFEGELIEEHKRDGIIFTVFVILTFLVKYTTDLHPNKKKWKALYVFLLLASGGAMIGAGHHGGEITHGNPLDSLPSKILAARKSHTLDENLVIYTELIHPILEEKCISCHGSKKKKSGLRMDTYRHMLAGGDEGECLVPGDLKKSGLITTLHLPLDDDLRMPPQDKPQLTNDEIKLLEWWVKAGAPETSTLGEIERSAEIDKALESTLGN